MSDDLAERLAMKAAMIELGERIAWGSDTEIMREAADRIDRLTTENASMWKANLRLIAERDKLRADLAKAVCALRLHQAWSDSEDAGPDYGEQTRDTHPEGERIWRQWWEGNLSICERAQDATRLVLADMKEGAE